MERTITYTSCPVCKSQAISKQLICKDHTVSQEEFEVWECSKCTLRFTQQVPSGEFIGKYYQSDNYISHSDTGKGLINKLYKIARRYTLRSKTSLVASITGLKTGSLLDIGCGTGAFLNSMKMAGWQVTGLEPDAGARQKASELYGIETLPAESLFNLPANNFNAITMWHVLEHVHDLHDYVQQFSKILTKGGKLFIAVPNYTSADAAHYQAGWAAYDVPRHLYHFSPASMKHLAESHGFSLSSIKPMMLDAFYISMLSEQYKKGNLLAALREGMACFFATVSDTKTSSSLTYILEKSNG